MKTLKEFKNYYRTDIFPDLMELEALRIKVFNDIRNFKTAFLMAGIILLPAIILIKIYFFPEISITSIIPVCIIIIIAICTLPYIYEANKLDETGFLSGFKQKIIKKMLSFYDESFTYNPGEHMSMEEFHKANLFPDIWQANSMYGDDLVKGKIGDVDITFSEIHISCRSSGRNSRTKKIFDGLFFKGEFKKPFRPTETGLVSRKNINCAIESDDGITFNIEKEVYQSCSGSAMYIAIPADKLFEPKLNRSLLSFDEIAEYMEYLLFITGIFQELAIEKGIGEKSIETAETAEKTCCPSCGLSDGHSEFCTAGKK
jgi:hypothetical protein